MNRISNSNLYQPSFAPGFLDDHAPRIIRDPRIAVVEIVANCWDAGADEVRITWPKDSVPDPIVIEDNGTGMTYEQFVQRWPQLKYNRRSSQGLTVHFPPGNRESHRKAFGRNGKGRHSMFCFANEYWVETWCSGEANLFSVKRASAIAPSPYEIAHIKKFSKEGHGTKVSTTLAKKYLPIQDIYDLIGSKFVTDPTFKIYLNEDLVELTNLEHLIDSRIIPVSGVGQIKISQVDTQKTSRTSHQHGIAWWVDKRLVGEPSWKGFDGDGLLDGRTSEAKRYTFVIEADVLSDEVREDWSGFRETENYKKVRAAARKHIRKRLMELMSDVHKAKKQAAIEANRDNIKKLPSESRYFIGQMVDGIQERMPTVKQDVLSTTVKVLSNLERARTGYTLLEQIASLKPNELDQLSEILDKWSVQAARVVLGELERRLTIISELESLTEDSGSDELHDIHPLIVQGLWMFGPEYESIHFRSNKALSTIIRELLQGKLNRPLTNPRRRPDIVVLPDSTVSVHASDAFNENSEVDGVDKVLIIELKRGGKSIGVEEYRQGDDYARELKKSGKVQSTTKINVFVLGTEVDRDVADDTERGNVTIRARAYSVILSRAHARTFHLIEKIKEVKEDLLDLDVEEVLQEDIKAHQ